MQKKSGDVETPLLPHMPFRATLQLLPCAAQLPQVSKLVDLAAMRRETAAAARCLADTPRSTAGSTGFVGDPYFVLCELELVRKGCASC